MKTDNIYIIKEDAITHFRKPYSFLSNFYNYKFNITYKGFTYNSVEAAYQAQKDPSQAEKFSKCIRSEFAKAMGQRLKNVRKDWDDVKYDVMKELVYLKFSQNERLKKLLLETGDRQLVELNTWGDTYWGVCNGVGFNYLGEILMDVRDKLKE